MKTARTAVSLVGILLIGGGYFASQYAYFLGDPGSYIKALESSSVPWLALGMMAATILLAFVRERDEGQAS